MKKVRISKRWVAVGLYALITLLTDFGKAAIVMQATDWDGMWWMNRVGWWCLQPINALIVIKAFFSSSSKEEEVEPIPLPEESEPHPGWERPTGGTTNAAHPEGGK